MSLPPPLPKTTQSHQPLMTDPNVSDSIPHPSFSPSKARHDAPVASQQSQVQQWLETVFHPDPVPDFERNSPESLSYLLQLKHPNDSANHTNQLFHAARVEILSQIPSSGSESSCEPPVTATASNSMDTTTPPFPTDQDYHQAICPPIKTGVDINGQKLLAQTLKSLPSSTKKELSELANLSLFLGMPSATSSKETVGTIVQSALISYAIDRTIKAFRVCQVNELNAEMREESRWLHELVERLRSMQPSAEDTERLHDRIAQWGRESKQLALKAGEYGERLSGLDRWVAPSPSVEEVCLQQKRVERRRNEVTKLRTRLTGYHGLPSDVDVARDEVRRAQIELDGLKNQKVELFSQLLQDRDESETE